MERVERAIVIPVRRRTAARILAETHLFARWWGEGSSIDARSGGAVVIRYPNGVIARGEVVEMALPERIAFTFGYESGTPFGPGATTVRITLEESENGTRLSLLHTLADAASRDAHAGGWSYHLAVFARVACEEQHASFADRARAWCAAWSESDAIRRSASLTGCVGDTIEFRDDHALVRGRAELEAHIAAARRHMRAARLELADVPRHCQGTGVFEWRAVDASGALLGRGTNVCDLDPDGRFARVVGIRAGS
jgi:uncharacterized protein YndB with AHSA1/START domain